MRKPFLVFEETDAARRRELFRLFGVRWMATRYAWLSPLFWWALGTAAALLEGRMGAGAGGWLAGAVYGAMLAAANTLHSLGHVAAGRLAGAPMAAVVLTATRDVGLAASPAAATARRPRVVRALGGPLANLLAGALVMVMATRVGSPWLLRLGIFHLAVGVWTLLPIPTLDGSVIWGALLSGGPAARRR